ncbi:Radical SAM domain protein [Candidatus Sulfotelmatobacter kueseliae]|uniref:Radical SAM domain protein n=1 Tax=Candidatus Sulfotelmatobacter kueseliae TaxID=2042962 RepID=A0A2U3L657_9BACT|nr:Radical SAM domain protein [Candidatus Sulfotelmatobacter kueseliae]
MQNHEAQVYASNHNAQSGGFEKHPKGSQARVLLSSVFGPYAQDDEFGSRSINPMELYHNQVTRAQGSFSLRMFHRSWGIMMIQANISAPCTVLDFPTRDDFARELKANQYDVVGISSIIVNVAKVREMCRIIRQISPHSVIVVGGHVAAIPGIETMIDADHIVRGEGVSWMRRYLGEDEDAPIRHPAIVSGMQTRIMGIRLPDRKGTTAATIIPSVGCPMGCNFCTTSAFFGGKGKFVNFFETGDELFDVMNRMERELKVRSFFVMDENFLLHRERALRLLERMKEARKSWTMSVFASANAIRKYTMQELVELGVSWLWMGLESPQASYSKLGGADTRQLTRELREHGIRVQGSTIIGLEHHTPDNIMAEIEHAVSHDTDFHQFMLYTPVPGTPLYQQMAEEGRLLSDVDYADVHGQFKFNFQHAAISRDDSKRFLDWAFWRDFEINGPSLYRISRTLLTGWKRYKDWPDARVRERFAREMGRLSGIYGSALWAMERRFRNVNRNVSEQIRALRQEFKRESGMVSRMMPAVLGPVLLWTTRREEKRLARGKTYEPPTILERTNWVEA